MALYLLTLTARLILDGQLPQIYLRERMAIRIRSKREHVVVCGYGRFGQAVVEELLEAGQAVVVMDENKELIPLLEIISPGSSPEVDLEQILVAPNSELSGSEVAEIEHNISSLRIVALRRGHESIQIAPSSKTIVEP